MRGAFITLEGTEGVGKSTNMQVLQHGVQSAGFEVLTTREPGGTPLGEKIRDWLLDVDSGTVSVQVEILLMFAARAHHLEQVIRPALAAGRWVICDRFSDATVAYQGGGRGADLRFVDQIRRAVHGDLEPDLTLLFDAPVEVGLARISDRETDRFERESHAFFERVRRAYLDLADRFPNRIKLIDATQSAAQVTASVERELAQLVRCWS
jgi:dTMP kinase